MNSKRQVKSQPKKSTDNEFVFTKPQLDNDGNVQFTEPAKKKSKLMIFLIAGGGVVLLLALSVLATRLLSPHKNNVAEESQSEVFEEEDTRLTTYEDFDISQITEPPLVESKHRPGEKKTLYCKGQAYVFRWCPPGTFTMGAPKSEEDLMSEKQHEVTLTRGFWMMETEVTQKQWKSVMRNNPSYYKGDDLPVENVTWYNCQELCKECTKLGMPVQLPTEAQWEYACRAGTTGPFAGNLDEMAWYGSNSGRQTHPVGTKKPNAWDLYDMHGNVWEWCQDWFGDYPSGSVTDPTGPSSGALRIMRGGSCGGINGICRSAFRFINEPDARDNMLGFRVIMTDKNMNAALANNMDQPPKEESVKEPVEENNKEKQSTANNSKEQSEHSTNDKPVDISAFDDLLPELPSGSKTSEPESSEPKPSDSETLDLEPKPKEAPKAGDILVKEIDREKFVFRWIPPGIFTMGSPEDEEGRNPNERQYKVKISKGFWMMETEVTQEQWMVVTGEFRGSSRPSPKKPIEDVSWYECNNFCKKAAAAGLPLELPTEAQWEYACRAGSRGAFAGSFEDLTWHHGNSDGHAQLIRTREPNKWGLYDMHGNVAEWVADWCGVYPSKPTKDPKGPADGAKKMTRGGSWGSPKHFCRSALRGGLDPNQRTVGLGFRCVLKDDSE